jgi:hypothetical protein
MKWAAGVLVGCSHKGIRSERNAILRQLDCACAL